VRFGLAGLPGFTVLTQGLQDRDEGAAFVGEAVIEARRVLAVGHLMDHACVFELLETVRQQVRRDAIECIEELE